MQTWLPFLYALAAIALLPPVARWFGLRVQRLVFVITGNPDAALYLYHFVLLPGTVLHELSHWLAAKLLGVRTGKLTLMPVRQGNVARFGSLQVGAADPLRSSLIGAAPLLMGTLAVAAIAHWRFDVSLAMAPTLHALKLLWQALRAAPDAPLWLYLIVAVANAMLPSASDRRSWHWVGLGLLVIVLGLYLVGHLASVAGVIAPRLQAIANATTLVGMVTILCDLSLGLLALLAELIINSVFRRGTDYA